MLWLVVVLLVGVSITLLEFSLEYISLWLERRGILKASTAEWFSNDTLQLQRMAHEELGVGHWQNCIGPRAVPVTESGELLGVFGGEDAKHPKLVNPNTVTGAVENCARTDQLDRSKESLDGSLTDVERASTSTSPDDSLTGSSVTLIEAKSPSVFKSLKTS